MKSLIKIILIIGAVFASTFIALKLLGVLSVEQIETWLAAAQALSPIYVAGLTIILLLADIVIAVPTLTITILSGFFLGNGYGALAASTGMFLAGCAGYGLGKYYGETILKFLLKDPHKIAEAKTAFQHNGFGMILLSRAVPILPEVTACLAGATQMRFGKFISAWSLSTLPYCLIATYSGSISSLDNPKPALITAAMLTATLWLGWYLFQKSVKLKNASNASNAVK